MLRFTRSSDSTFPYCKPWKNSSPGKHGMKLANAFIFCSFNIMAVPLLQWGTRVFNLFLLYTLAACYSGSSTFLFHPKSGSFVCQDMIHTHMLKWKKILCTSELQWPLFPSHTHMTAVMVINLKPIDAVMIENRTRCELDHRICFSEGVCICKRDL